MPSLIPKFSDQDVPVIPPERQSVIYADRVEVLYRGSRDASLVSMLNSVLVAVVLHGVASMAVLVPWVGYIFTAAIGRMALSARYWRAADRKERAAAWGQRYIILSGLLGLGWGIGAVLFFPVESLVHQIFVIFVLAGMGAGAATYLSSIKLAFASFFIPLLLPIMVRLITIGDEAHLFMGIMGGLYMVALWATASRMYLTILTSLNLRHENRELIAYLTTAKDDADRLNDDLKAEIAQRRQAEAALRESEEQLRHSQKMEAVGKLAGGVAHEFNNLLQVIRGYCFFLQDEAGPRDAIRRDVEAIQETVDRASNLTGQLLAFSRRHVTMPRVLDLNAQIMEQYRMLQRLIGEDITLDVQLEPRLGRIKADPAQVGQVLLNLVNNARDAMPKGGTLTIATANRPLPDAEPGAAAVPYVALTVMDTGAGIPPEIVDRIFEPFFTTKEVGKGTGLGLSTVYGLVTQAGGQIRVHSQVGKGTTFTVFWPKVGEVESVPGDAPATAPVPRASATVLLVEDDEAVRRQLGLALERQGYRVLEAGDGRQALHVAAGHTAPIHLLVTDVVMPNIGGRELAGQLTAARPALRTIYVSGFPAGQEDERAMTGPAAAYLQKPFTPDRLVRTAHELLHPGAATIDG